MAPGVAGVAVLRLASYNVCNLYDDGGPDTGGKPRAARRALARVIDALGADLLALQEVAGAAALARLNASLARPYPQSRLFPGNDRRGMHLALLSRYPLRTASFHRQPLTGEHGAPLYDHADETAAGAGWLKPLRFQRTLALAELRPPGPPLALFMVHLKSSARQPWRRLDNDAVRQAEARAATALIADWRQRNPGTPLALLGDLNEPAERPAVRHLIETLQLRDALAVDWLAPGRTPGCTWRRRNRRSRLDYLLLDRAAAALWLPGSARVHASAGARKASDHYPVSVDLLTIGAKIALQSSDLADTAPQRPGADAGVR